MNQGSAQRTGNQEPEKNLKGGTVAVIAITSLAITYFHYTTIPVFYDLHSIFTELYYIPLLLGAFAFGLKGSAATFVFVSLLYTPHVIMNWSGSFTYIASNVSHAVFSGSIALLAGYLVDREKRHREQAEKARYLAGLGQAAAAIVHDLKNPIITIQGFARRIREHRGNTTEAAGIIYSAADTMKTIVSDVLDFARPIRLKSEDVDINGLIRTVEGYCREKAGKKGVDLSISLAGGSRAVHVDRSHMERALINLVNNALEASSEGQRVDISVNGEGSSVNIIIRDYGEGMDSETLENIFIPFYSRKSQGTGLGMAIAKKVIEGHRGEIHVDSTVGKGTEVTLEVSGV